MGDVISTALPTEFSPLMSAIFACYYSVIFVLASVGNVLALLTCYKTYRTTTSVLLCYIASLATADLMFTLLSTFDLAYFFVGTWVGGNAVCKIQSFFIETSYTASILTLVAISYERLKACVNTSWGDEGRQIYYGIQAVLLFLVPLGIMIWAHVKIFRSLGQHITARNKIITNSHEGVKQRKVTKMLAVVTLLFAICYIPFIVIRALRYFYAYTGDEVWRLVQLLVFTQAAFNPIIYCLYSNQFRLSYKDLLRCRFTVTEPKRKPRSASALSTTSSSRIGNSFSRGSSCRIQFSVGKPKGDEV